MSKISISWLSLSDKQALQEVIELQSRLVLRSRSVEDAEKMGFLLSCPTYEFLQEFLLSRGKIAIAKEGKCVVGSALLETGETFLANYKSTQLSFPHLLPAAKEQFIKTGAFDYIHEICVGIDSLQRGIGSQLYYFIAKEFKYPLAVAAIVEQPTRNIASLAFFNKLGLYQKFIKWVVIYFCKKS